MKLKWTERPSAGKFSETINNIFISYQPNEGLNNYSDLDSANPETAIVLVGDKPGGKNRYLILRGDHSQELEELMPDRDKLVNYWKVGPHHFWSDDIEDNETPTI